MESVSGFFFCARIHIRVCLEYHRKDPLAKSRKHIVKKLASKKIKIMQNVAKNKLRRFLKQKICRKTFFLIWTKCVAFWRLALNSYKNSSFLREKSDYDDFFIASKKDAEMQLEGAREFLGAVEAYYKQYKD